MVMFDKKTCKICGKNTKTNICKDCAREVSNCALALWLGDAPTSDNALIRHTATLALDARYGKDWEVRK